MCRAILIILLMVAPPVIAEQTTASTPPTIRVGLDASYPPYSFRSEDGKLQGILIDQWLAWEKKTGVQVEFHAMDWVDLLDRMRAGEFDVIACIVETPARREYFDFSPPFARMEVPIFFHKSISGITDLASLKGFPLGVKQGDQHIDIYKAHGVTRLIPFPNHDAITAAAAQHKINVFAFDEPSALYFLNKYGIESEFRQSAPIFQDQLRRAVRKGDTDMLRLISNGFATRTGSHAHGCARDVEQTDRRAVGHQGDYREDSTRQRDVENEGDIRRRTGARFRKTRNPVKHYWRRLIPRYD